MSNNFENIVNFICPTPKIHSAVEAEVVVKMEGVDTSGTGLLLVLGAPISIRPSGYNVRPFSDHPPLLALSVPGHPRRLV